jgi:rare lipoprotein A
VSGAPVHRVAKQFESAARGNASARAVAIAVPAAVVLLCAGCGRHVPATASAPRPARIGLTETGIASWYGPPYHGRRTASGEIYDMEQLTAAHKELPFQTWVEVTNLGNGRRVDVRITDRGPFIRGRIIDLSLAAARDIDMERAGTARVRLKVIRAPAQEKPAAPQSSPAADIEGVEGATQEVRSKTYTVQAGAFADRGRAQALCDALRESLPVKDARLVSPAGDPPLWRVLVGRRLTAESAAEIATQVRQTSGAALVVEERGADPPSGEPCS